MTPSRAARSRAWRHRLAAVVAAALLAVGCDGDAPQDVTSGLGEDGVLRVLATDDLRFEPENVAVPAGATAVELICGEQVNHNLVVDTTGEEVVACTPGRTATGTVELAPGTHPVRCTVPGHEATMRAEFVVE